MRPVLQWLSADAHLCVRLKAAAEVEELRDKIAQLEAALSTLQATVSDEPHPLLKDKASPLDAAAGPSSDSPGGPPSSGSSESPRSSQSPTAQARDEVDDVIDAYG